MQNKKPEIKIFYLEDWPLGSAQDKTDYELLDTGGGEKLERFGKYIFVRPYEGAVWHKTLPDKEWENADGKFWSSKTGAKGGWKFFKDGSWENSLKNRPFKWVMSYRDIKFYASPTPFRHLGFFPEQASHWDFIESALTRLRQDVRPLKFLNLFGYTGVASLFALRAGAEVTHVDASKQTLKWAKENQELSGLGELPMRIIEDDVIKFLEREIKRGNKYDAVIMDPPKFGRGPKGETWKIEEDLPKLLSQVRKVLSDKPLFVILTSYATDSSSLTLGYALDEMMKPVRNATQYDARPHDSLQRVGQADGDFSGTIEMGELCVLEKSNNRLISLANTAIWSRIE